MPDPTFEEFRDTTLANARTVGADLTKPDDDWAHVLLMLTPDRPMIVMLNDLLNTRAGKESLPGVLAELFRRHRPSLAALVVSCWHRRVLDHGPLAALTMHMLDTYGVSTDPQRQELLMVDVASSARDEQWYADIQRHPQKPPTLGPWRVVTDEDIRYVGGTQGRVLARAFAASSRARNRR
jgi:hypothetical protein